MTVWRAVRGGPHPGAGGLGALEGCGVGTQEKDREQAIEPLTQCSSLYTAGNGKGWDF